jgi:hypothetical protein
MRTGLSDPAVGARLVFGAVAVFFLIPPAAELVDAGNRLSEIWGVDYRLYTDAARRWFEGGMFYPADQFTGPFVDDGKRILYPPTALLLFVPFAFLPPVLWWAIPAAVAVWQMARFRPSPVVWPFLAMCVAWSPTPLTIAVGNPVILFVALFTLGTVYGWPAALIVLKPAVAPFALWGIRRRSWWLALGVVGIVSLPFGAMWLEWLTVLLNSQVGGVLHSTQQFPLFFFPLMVWAGRAGGPLAVRWERLRSPADAATRQPPAG